ncbi:thymidylate kinase-like isoform X4 [Punica granatum]|nr:thymidylate kinase-like isoform X4 [Punica granatum]
MAPELVLNLDLGQGEFHVLSLMCFSFGNFSCKLDMTIACNFAVSKASILGAVKVKKPFRLTSNYFSRKYFVRKITMSNCQRNDLNGVSTEARGALIVLEGLDRSGKTSQSSRLLSYLEGLGHSAELWRFPDRTTSVGKMISSYLSNESQLDDHTIHLLFSANRWEKKSLMEEKLKSGTSLIVDRYSYSGVAFSSAKGLDIDWCKRSGCWHQILSSISISCPRKLLKEEDMEVRDMRSSNSRRRLLHIIKFSVMLPGR